MLGVCIVLDNNNFGSMLQSFATQKTLQKLGVDYELIRYRKKKSPKLLLRLFNPVMWSDKAILLKRKINIMRYPELKSQAAERINAFNSFRKENFKYMAPVSNGYEELLLAGKKYDGYFVGSDQLWSPSGLETNFYNLMFVDSSKPKMSYAASFGVDKIQDKQKDATINYLNRIENISVRENSGAKIVKELTGRDAKVVLDPTLLFDSEGWDELIGGERIIEEPYILVYFLGDSKEHRKAVLDLKEKTGKKIVLIPMERLHKANEDLADYASYKHGPDDFVRLIKHADYVCTDSFHGMVFSTIYHRKFIVFNRYSDDAKDSKNTRIDSFCENLGLTDRRFDKEFLEKIDREIDFADVDERLKNYRRESLEFLTNALKGMNQE